LVDLVSDRIDAAGPAPALVLDEREIPMTSVSQHAMMSHRTEAPWVRWEPIRFRNVVLDGCWWPDSRDPAAELPGLVGAVDGLRSPVVRLLLSAAGWATRPHDVVVAGRSVSIGYFAGQSPATLTAICADGGIVTVLVTPRSAPAGADPDQQAWESEGGQLAAPRPPASSGRAAGC
jgi:hypothetical protein